MSIRKFVRTALIVLLVSGASVASADVLANWTFEVSIPVTGGPHAAELGNFAATSFASSNSGGTFSNPSGNGSLESFSSNGWNDTEYYQLLTSSTGYEDITISFSQAASNTGPGNFQFQYSTDGVNYINFDPVYLGPTPDFGPVFNATNVKTFDLSTIPGLDNQAAIGFRVAVSGTIAENGGALASTGTFRIDDFVVNGNPLAIPEPAAGFTLIALAGLAGLVRRRRS